MGLPSARDAPSAPIILSKMSTFFFDQMRQIRADIFLIFDSGRSASKFGGHVQNRFLAVRNVVGTGTWVLGTAPFLFAGYVFVMEIPDLKRYIKISRT
jgi:hypothetical protein